MLYWVDATLGDGYGSTVSYNFQVSFQQYSKTLRMVIKPLKVLDLVVEDGKVTAGSQTGNPKSIFLGS